MQNEDNLTSVTDPSALKSVLVTRIGWRYLKSRQFGGSGLVSRTHKLGGGTYIVDFHDHKDAVDLLCEKDHSTTRGAVVFFLYDGHSRSVYSGHQAVSWLDEKEKQTVGIQRVDPKAPNTVLVTGFPDGFSVTADSIKAHFRNLLNGRCHVKGVQYLEPAGIPVVKFERCEDARRVAGMRTSEMNNGTLPFPVYMFLYRGALPQHEDVIHSAIAAVPQHNAESSVGVGQTQVRERNQSLGEVVTPPHSSNTQTHTEIPCAASNAAMRDRLQTTAKMPVATLVSLGIVTSETHSTVSNVDCMQISKTAKEKPLGGTQVTHALSAPPQGSKVRSFKTVTTRAAHVGDSVHKVDKPRTQANTQGVETKDASDMPSTITPGKMPRAQPHPQVAETKETSNTDTNNEVSPGVPDATHIREEASFPVLYEKQTVGSQDSIDAFTGYIQAEMRRVKDEIGADMEARFQTEKEDIQKKCQAKLKWAKDFMESQIQAKQKAEMKRVESEFQKELLRLQAQIEELSRQKDQIEANNQARVKAEMKCVESMQGKLEQLSRQKDGMEINTQMRLQDERIRAENKLKKEFSRTKHQLEEFRRAKDQLEAQMKAYVEDKAKMQSDMSRLEARMLSAIVQPQASLRSTVSELETQVKSGITSLENHVSQLRSNVNKTTSELTSMRDETGQMRNQMNASDNKLQKLASEQTKLLGRMTTEMTQVRTDLEVHQRKCQAAHTQNGAHQRECQAAHAHHVAHQLECQAAHTQHKAHQRQCQEAHAQHEAHQRECRAAQKQNEIFSRVSSRVAFDTQNSFMFHMAAELAALEGRFQTSAGQYVQAEQGLASQGGNHGVTEDWKSGLVVTNPSETNSLCEDEN